MRIEDYAIIGDTQTVALVGRDGSIDWLCLPRFDSAACFAALLGTRENGRFRIAPHEAARTRRRYRGDTLVLETEHTTASGVVRVVDCMPIRGRYPDVVRVVEGVSGTVTMDVELLLRFDDGSLTPWTRTVEGRLRAVAGPDAIVVRTPVTLREQGAARVGRFDVHEGDRVPFVLTWHPSHDPSIESAEPGRAVDDTERWWTAWAARADVRGPHRDAVVRSLVTLKALTYAPTGGIVAAGTTSLPEVLGGERNWDYRYCWLRDATFTLYSLLHSGYRDEASAFRDWLLRAIAGEPDRLRIMYGVAGERHLPERVIDYLPGYEGSRPVRVGNGAAGQLQLDVYGEVLDTFHQARRMGVPPDPASWALQVALGDWLESSWSQPDDGLWEMRGPRRDFVHSKVMTWVAMDRLVKAVEAHGMKGPVDRWRRVRAEIHADVCAKGWNAERGSFTQSYGATELDASLLLIPMVGFLPPDDSRVVATVDAIARELGVDGFVRRYKTGEGKNDDGFHGREGAFLACSFWLVDALALLGRRTEARRLFERLLAVRNDVGLLSEEYDVEHERLVGNFPQAFSHVALVNAARTLAGDAGAAAERGRT